jgi:hypothetical protein
LRKTPRDLSERSTPDRAGEVEDHHPATDEVTLAGVITPGE